MTDNFDWLFDDDRVETTETLNAPVKAERDIQQRLFVNGLKKQALNVLIPVLPPEHVDVYILSNGSGSEAKWKPGGINQNAFDFGTFIPHLIDLLGGENITVYASTWTLNRNHAHAFIEALSDGRIGKLTLFTDPYFIQRESSVHSVLMNGFREYPDRTRYLAFKNHVKALCLSTPDGAQVVTVTGSSNFSSQPRCEQFNLTTNLETYTFYVEQFFETMWTQVHDKAK